MLNRRALVAKLLKSRGDALLITGLGSAAYDAAAAGDDTRNFYLWGAMGSAAMVGLGLALAQSERRIVVLTGDGEMMMGIGSLATIAVQRPSNLAVLVLDNEAFGETGRQAGLTGKGVDICSIARGAGFLATSLVKQEEDLGALVELLIRTRGPVLAVAKVALDSEELVLPARDGRYLAQRFRMNLLGPARAVT